jgi:NAD(P)-dependent dehydrogenase (short-subunit alcohol dehydrogenase family)
MEIPPVKSLLDFTGKVVVVTGSGSGLGQGIAARFAQAGAAVVIHYRTSAAGADQLMRRLKHEGARVITQSGDLTQPSAAAELMAHAVEEFGRVDVLINNAGTFPLHSLMEMTPEQWDAVVDANLRTVHLCTQAAARHMRDHAQEGAIVNITTIEAENPAPLHAHYDAAKGGVLMYTRAAANELAAYGIRVNAVAPGLIWREGIEQAWSDGVARWRKSAPLKRLGLPEDVADACLFLASPAARWITGASLTVDGGVMTHQIF